MFRRQAYYIASVVFIVFGMVYFIVTINQPYIGLDLENSIGQWFVTASDPDGEGYQAGVRVGDIVIKINDDVPSNYRFIKKWGVAEGASSIVVRRSDLPTIDNLIKLPVSTNWLKNVKEIPLHILGFVFWLLGFMTWFKRPFLAQARAIFWLNWIIGLVIVLSSASGRCLPFAKELCYISMSFVPVFLINLVSIFPKDNRNRVNRFSCHIFVIIAIVLMTFTILQSRGIINNVSLLRKLILSTDIIALLLALRNLGSLIMQPKDNPEKNQAGILFLGMMIGFFPFVILTAVPLLLDFQPIRYFTFISLFLSVIPVSLYYVIVNRYLPDSRRLLETIISFFVSGVIISFVVSYVLCLLKVVKNLNLEVYFASLSLTMLFMICISVMRVVISKLLEKLAFFEEKQDFKNRVLKLNESLISINEEDRILEEVVTSLSIEGAFIVLENAKRGYLKKAIGRFLENPSQQAELEEFFQADQRINLAAKILPENFPAEIYIPVVYEDFSCGIFLGHRYSHVKFELDELPLITLISSQSAQRLITTFVIKELSKEIKLLAQSSQDSQRRNQGLQGIATSLFRNLENERKLVAFEIHDGPLQLGLDLNRWLKYLVDECSIDNKTMKVISHMREIVENLNFELRLISDDLRPPSLTDLGLLTAVELMCEEIMLKELSLISLETVGINREGRFKEEIELAAYRFLQEGIMNAVKHSGSNKLKLHIEMIESNLELTVRDSGKGFDTNKIDDWLLTGAHFGIVGMKERLESLGGALQITSEIHQGTMLKATIPIT